MPAPTSPEFLTLPEAASILRLKVATLRAWVLRRKIRYCKIGRLVRIRRADIEALIQTGTIPARDVRRG